MPVAAMAAPVVDHQKRFQAAVEVIQSLPKNGSYRPSSDVMLRFYSLYKQAVVGPCLAPRPSFWDPVGRYKWDAWSRLGDMSRDIAMETYVEEMKKVAAEVIGTMPMNEKTASLFHYFEPLYQVIQDMPRPPQALLSLREAVGDSDQTHSQSEEEAEEEEADFVKELGMEGRDPPADQEVSEKLVLTKTLNDSGLGEGLLLLSDSESEIFCDSVDSVDLLNTNKVEVKGRHTHPESPRVLSQHLEAVAEAKQVGAGQGGEWEQGEQGAPEGRERSEDAGRDRAHHRWREGVVSPGGPRQAQERGDGSPGRGGGDGEEGGAAERRDGPLQQHIAAALKTLRQDMKNVIERLETVEKLAAHAPCAEGRGCLRCNSASERQDKRWPFDVSGRTLLLLLLWPLAAHGLILLLGRRRGPRGSRIVSS